MVAGSDVTGWFSGNALGYGLDDHGLESRWFLLDFFFFFFFFLFIFKVFLPEQ